MRNEKRGFNFFPEDKRGQFFLIAAVIIIVAVVGIATISNYTLSQESVKMYDLGEEIGIESRNVLESGTYNRAEPSVLTERMEKVMDIYADKVEENTNIYFVFGNKDGIVVRAYQDSGSGEAVCVIVESETMKTDCEPLEDLTGKTSQPFSITNEELNSVLVQVAEAEYQFALKEGENFYFIISQEAGANKQVVTSNE